MYRIFRKNYNMHYLSNFIVHGRYIAYGIYTLMHKISNLYLLYCNYCKCQSKQGKSQEYCNFLK